MHRLAGDAGGPRAGEEQHHVDDRGARRLGQAAPHPAGPGEQGAARVGRVALDLHVVGLARRARGERGVDADAVPGQRRPEVARRALEGAGRAGLCRELLRTPPTFLGTPLIM